MKLLSISGCGHSGTTLTATVLGSHKNIFLHPDETFAFVNKNYSLIEYLMTKEYDSKIKYVIEKTPRHIYFIDKIKELYPNSKLIVNVRDPRDIAASLYKRSGDWNQSLDRLEKDLYHIDKFKDSIYLIKYEDIVEDFSNTFTLACNFLNLEFDDNIKNYYKNAPNWYNLKNPKNNDGVGEKNHINRRAWQVKQPIFDGRGRWQKELSSNQLLDLEKRIYPIASKFGYSI